MQTRRHPHWESTRATDQAKMLHGLLFGVVLTIITLILALK